VFDGEKPHDRKVSLWMSRQATSPAPRPVSGLRPRVASAKRVEATSKRHGRACAARGCGCC
jgi:hypothetical protein